MSLKHPNSDLYKVELGGIAFSIAAYVVEWMRHMNYMTDEP